MSKPRKSSAPLILVGIAAAAFLLLVVGIVGIFVVWRANPGGVVSGVAGPSASREGEDWSHQDLINYLTARNLAYSTYDQNPGFLGAGPSMCFARDLSAHEKIGKEPDWKVDSLPGMVRVYKHATAQMARDQIAVERQVNARGSWGALAWGRFLFVSTDGEYLNAIRAALGG